jgi:phage tail sheath protein FI
MNTPGVYIVEKNAFPNSVVEVATAVPAFIGYTKKADNNGLPLTGKAWPVSSLREFETYFGGAPTPTFKIVTPVPAAPAEPSPVPDDPTFAAGTTNYALTQQSGLFLLYYSMVMFFENGGSKCYVVSVGNYGDQIAEGNSASTPGLMTGLTALLEEQEPTMVVIPEAVLLRSSQCYDLQQQVLLHCGIDMSRVGVFDVWGGFRDIKAPALAGNCIENFRNGINIHFLNFGAAYYPWLNTVTVAAADLDYTAISNPDVLKTVLIAGIDPALKQDTKTQITDVINTIPAAGAQPDSAKFTTATLNTTLLAQSPTFRNIISLIQTRLNVLPPSGAIAGLYTMVDSNRGVWKAPANVGVNGVVSPTVNITPDEQEDLNVPTDGKAVNAIRTFIGEGTLVWGARTLDANSLDWRYINVRRTMIMLEQSMKLAAKAYVFEDNVSTTWEAIKSMIRNFLTGVWKRGGLAGAVPEDAFEVSCGLGETMTADDILKGILRVTVLVAMVRPAEFIEITFQQQMQKS